MKSRPSRPWVGRINVVLRVLVIRIKFWVLGVNREFLFKVYFGLEVLIDCLGCRSSNRIGSLVIQVYK